MAQVLVRNLPEDTVKRLKEKAAAQRLSLEQYLRDMLTRDAAPNKADAFARLRDLREAAPKLDFDFTQAIRQDRER